MKIVIAPDSFKESLSAEKCCQAIKAGFSTLFPDANYICLRMAAKGRWMRWSPRRAATS
ncbi:hypothetical protein C5N39_003107 [Escherichia coli]|nr:hypothetical protein [Escherichia coli]